MWKIFLCWGRVTGMFINRKLNGRGQRYYLVIFVEVGNEVEIEKK